MTMMVKRLGMEENLGVNKFNVDDGHEHIVIEKEKFSIDELAKLIKACPAALYDLDDQGNIRFDFAGCLECGTCRVLCGNTLIKKWNYPQGTFGIEYRFG